MKASATGIRLPEAPDAKRALKQQRDLWEAERKKHKVKQGKNTASGKELMFKGKGKCHNGCGALDGAERNICGGQRRNSRDTIEPKESTLDSGRRRRNRTSGRRSARKRR